MVKIDFEKSFAWLLESLWPVDIKKITMWQGVVHAWSRLIFWGGLVLLVFKACNACCVPTEQENRERKAREELDSGCDFTCHPKKYLIRNNKCYCDLETGWIETKVRE